MNFLKKIAFLAVFFAILPLLTACGSQGEAVNGNSWSAKQPDFGQPERQADISGIVKSVVGNEITVIKMERPEGFSDLSSGENNTQNQSEGTAVSLGGIGVGPGMGGERPGGDREGGGFDESQMLERIKEMGAGEETITVPVGIQMLKMDTTDTGNQTGMVEATLSDIVADKMIMIWLDESITDRSVASFVVITR